MDVYRGVAPLTDKELEYWRRTLESRRDFLAEIGYPLSVRAGAEQTGDLPRAHAGASVAGRSDPRRPTRALPVEDLRRRVRRPASCLDAGQASGPPRGRGLHLLSPRDALDPARGAGRGRGSPDFRSGWRRGFALGEGRLPDRWTPVESQQGDSWAARLYLADRLRQSVWRPESAWESSGPTLRQGEDAARRLRWYEQDDASLPRALILHDSFGQALFELLPRFFSRTCFVWTHDFEPALIRAERPDVVLQVFVDRTLVALAPVPLGAAGSDFARQQFERSSRVLLAIDAAAQRTCGGGVPQRAPVGRTRGPRDRRHRRGWLGAAARVRVSRGPQSTGPLRADEPRRYDLRPVLSNAEPTANTSAPGSTSCRSRRARILSTWSYSHRTWPAASCCGPDARRDVTRCTSSKCAVSSVEMNLGGSPGATPVLTFCVFPEGWDLAVPQAS